MICCKEIDDYIKFVEENPLETNDEIKLLIKNIIKPTLSRDDVFFDCETFKMAIKYCEKWYYELFPYEKFIYALFFIYKNSTKNIVLFREIFILMGRGNGKDGMIMPLANFFQTPFYGVENYHIDIVANSEEQACNSFNVVYNMLEANKGIMQKYFSWNKTIIVNKQTRSILRYNTSNAKTKDSKQTGMIIYNEFHAYEDYKQINVFKSGLGKVKNARIVIISTNGKIRGGPLDEKISISNNILNNSLKLIKILPIIYKIGAAELVDIPMKKYMITQKEEDIDITYWCQANPSLRFRPTLQEEMINDYIDMQHTPSYKAEFYAKRMNLPQQDEETNVTNWENIRRASYSDVEKEIPRETGKIIGKSAIVGIDFASLNDFASAGFLFKLKDEYVWRQKTWICSKSKFYNDIKFPFDNIGQEGFRDFEITNEDSISARSIVMWILNEMSKYNVKKIVLDMYRFKLLEQAFKEVGITVESRDNPYGLVRMIKFPASIAAIVAPMIEVAFAEGKINIGNSAIMRWAINNTAVVDRKDGNKMYIKIEPKLRKNDPFMAFVASMSVQELLDDGSNVIYV